MSTGNTRSSAVRTVAIGQLRQSRRACYSNSMKLVPDFDLSRLNTLGLPATAQLGTLVTAVDEVEALASRARLAGLPLHIIGGGSNLVLRDRLDAVVGVMASKGRELVDRRDGQIFVRAQAGEDWAEFVSWTVREGFWGLENLASIPGTVGAAPVQNIGAYGLELSDRFHALTAFDTETGERRVFGRDELGFSYRQSMLKQHAGRFIVLDVTFALPEAWRPNLGYAGLDTLPADTDAPNVFERVAAIRAEKLPDWRKLGNAGSFFHNPIVPVEVAQAITGGPRYPQPGGAIKLSAAWLIDACGLKGVREGGAGIYDKHALIIVNHGGATYRDVSTLAERVKRTVHQRFGVSLTQEPIEL
ncbi:MAG: UDP-N-acetylmuramate dehydrogenase [Devosia sp.]